MKWYRVIITPYQLQQYATVKSQRQVPVRMLRRGDVPSWYWGHQWPPVAGSATSRRSAQTAVLFYGDGPKCKSKIPLNINTFQRKTESAIDRIIMYISIKQFKCRTVLVCFSIPFTRLMSLSFNVFLLKSTVTGLNVTIIIDVEF